MVVTETR